MKNKVVYLIFKIVLLMLCSVVGVGFISGAEIYSFFVKFGKLFYFQISILFVILFCLVYKIFSQNLKTENTLKMNNFNKNTAKYTFLIKSKIKSILIFLNLVLMSAAMFSGLFLTIKNLLNNNYCFVWILLILLIFFVLCFGFGGLVKIDIIVGLILLFLSFWFVKNLRHQEMIFNEEYSSKFVFESIFFVVAYIFMNIVQIEPIAGEFGSGLNKKYVLIISLLFSFIFILFLVIFAKFLNGNQQYISYEMPFFEYFKNVGGVKFALFICGLFLAILSSLLTALVGVKQRLFNVFKGNILSSGLAIFVSLLLSLIGFSNFVQVVYPIVGVINFIIFVFL